MTQAPDTGNVVWRFDLSQQFTAVQRISAALSRATDIGQALQAVLRVLHDDAFMQHGMICLYDPQRGGLRVEALYCEDQRVLSSSSQVCYRPGEGLVGTVMTQRQPLTLPRVADDQRFLDRLNLYDYELPFIGVPLLGIEQQPIGVLAAQPMARYEERLPASTRFLETVASLIVQTVRLMRAPGATANHRRRRAARPPVKRRGRSALTTWWGKARRCARRWRSSVRCRAGTPRCWCAARAAPVKSWWRTPSTTIRRARRRRS